MQVEVHELSKRYGSVQALAGVSFEARPGAVLGLLGPNGAGKTTLLRILCGIARADGGAVRFRGADGRARASLARADLGYLPEERGLYPDARVAPTLEYLGRLRGLSRAEARREGAAWLERLGLADRAGERVKALSKGNQQKLQFAAAVLHRPAVVVLDEPFSGLDPLNQDVFCELLGELRDQGLTVLLSAHQLALVQRVVDELVVLARGRTVLRGSLDEVLARGALAPRLFVRTTVEPPVPTVASGVARVEREGDELVLALTSAADLGPALRWAAEHLAPTAVRTERADLHGTYVAAVSAEASAGDEAT